MKKLIFLLAVTLVVAEATAQPIRLAVAGISHGHVSWILGRKMTQWPSSLPSTSRISYWQTR